MNNNKEAEIKKYIQGVFERHDKNFHYKNKNNELIYEIIIVIIDNRKTYF
jgi:hypothetical protein